MEFGLFIGGWVPDYLDGRDDDAEHRRLLDEVRVAVSGVVRGPERFGRG